MGDNPTAEYKKIYIYYNMNLKESIKRILREEREELFLRRRISCFDEYLDKLESGEEEIPSSLYLSLSWGSMQTIFTAFMRNYCDKNRTHYFDEKIHSDIIKKYDERLYQIYKRNKG